MRTVRCSGHLSCHAWHLPCTPLAQMHPLSCMPPALHPLHHAHPFCYAQIPAMHSLFTVHTPPSPNMLPFAMHAPLHHAGTPVVDRMTDACENITFPQLLLRTAKSALDKYHQECTLRETYLSLFRKVLPETKTSLNFLFDIIIKHDQQEL